MKKTRFLTVISLLSGFVPGAFSATTTGTFNAILTLTTGCLVNGQTATTGLNLGTLDFGSSAATFNALTATLVGPVGNGIYVRCTTGQTYNVQITSSNGAPATVYGAVSSQPRYLLLNSDNTQGIAYTLYSNAGFTTPIANNTNLVASGTSSPTLGDNYPIYGQITGGNYNVAVPAGTYTDTINVAVNY